MTMMLSSDDITVTAMCMIMPAKTHISVIMVSAAAAGRGGDDLPIKYMIMITTAMTMMTVQRS